MRSHVGPTVYYKCILCKTMLHVDLHIRMELELVSLVSNRKVTLSDPVPASLKGHLVASQPALVPHHCCTMNGCPINVVMNVAAKVNVVALVARLDLAALLAGKVFVGEDRLLMSEAKVAWS